MRRSELRVVVQPLDVSEMVEALQGILHELEVSNMPPGPAGIRDELRRRTAERLYVGRQLLAVQHSPNHLTPPGELVTLASYCWAAAGILADMDPESEERRRGAASITESQERSAGVPAAGVGPQSGHSADRGSDGVDGHAV